MADLIYRFDPAHAAAHEVPTTSEEARKRLVDGNREFVRLTDAENGPHRKNVNLIDPRAFGWGGAKGSFPAQTPFAAVLSCSDARVPTELVFAKGCNELFVVRVAGNVLGQQCFDSLRYCVSHLSSSLKLLVVLGHSQCGAVTEAVYAYLEPERYMQMATDHSLRAIDESILVLIRVAALSIEHLYGARLAEDAGYRAALLEVAVALNAAWSAFCLYREFGSHPDLGIVFGRYDLLSRSIGLPLSDEEPQSKGLVAAPTNVEQFRELAYRICCSNPVRALLRGGYAGRQTDTNVIMQLR